MILSVVVGLAMASEPQWDSLETSSGWTSVSTRASDIGPVQVYRKDIGGITCLQGVTTTQVSPEKLLEVVVDIPSSTRWSSATLTASDVVARPGSKLHFYQYLDVPNWTLVADRYWVLEGRPETVTGGFRFRWNRIDAASTYPAVAAKAQAISSSVIEPPTNWGEWTFSATDGGTLVAYRACADVGGALPKDVQSWVATRTLPDTVADAVREAGRR